MMDVSWQSAVNTPAEVVYRDFAYSRLESQMAEQAQNLKDAKKP